jgi:hypothetical protein
MLHSGASIATGPKQNQAQIVDFPSGGKKPDYYTQAVHTPCE